MIFTIRSWWEKNRPGRWLREVIEKKGLFCALYSDRGMHFFVTPTGREKVDKHRLKQVERAMLRCGSRVR